MMSILSTELLPEESTRSAVLLQIWTHTNWKFYTQSETRQESHLLLKNLIAEFLLTQPKQSGGNGRKFQLQMNFFSKNTDLKFCRVYVFTISTNFTKTLRYPLLLSHSVPTIPNRNASPLSIPVNLSSAATARSIVAPWHYTPQCKRGRVQCREHSGWQQGGQSMMTKQMQNV